MLDKLEKMFPKIATVLFILMFLAFTISILILPTEFRSGVYTRFEEIQGTHTCNAEEILKMKATIKKLQYEIELNRVMLTSAWIVATEGHKRWR